MNTHGSSESGFLKGVTKIFHRDEAQKQPPKTPAAQAPSLRDSTIELESRLKALTEKIEERRREQEQKAAISSGRIESKISEADRERIKEARTEKIHQEIRQEILEWHTRLDTKIGPDELNELHAFMKEMTGMAVGRPGQSLDDRIRGAIVKRLFVETGQRSWDDMLQRMESAGENWPAADEQTRTAEINAAAELFLESGIRSMTDLVVGIVTVWKDHYPARDTSLRKSVCFRAVAAGLRAALLRQVVDLVRKEADDLRREAHQLLEKEVETVQSVLDAGVNSIEHADNIMTGASDLLEQVLPALCVERVRHLLEPRSE